MPRPDKGYWVERRTLEFAGDIYTCPRQTCTGAKEQVSAGRRQRRLDEDQDLCWDQTSYSSQASAACNADELLCAEGASGPLCGSCVAGFSYSNSRLVCVECREAKAQAFAVIGGGLLLGVLAVAAFAGTLRLPACVLNSRPAQALAQIDSGTLRVCWTSYQIAQSVSWNLDVSFPEPFPSLQRLLSVFSFDFIRMDCFAGSDFFYNVVLWAVIPMALSLLNLAVLLVRRRCVGDFSKDWAARRQALSRSHFYYWLLFSYLVLPPVMLKLLQALDCTLVGGRRYLRVNTSIDCGSSSFGAFKVVDSIFIAAYAAVPFLWFVLLCRRRQSMDPWPRDAKKSLYSRNKDQEIAHLRFLFGEYRLTCYAWEPLDMLRRVVFIGVLPLLSSKSSRRAAFGMVFATSSAVLFREVEPFARPATNVLAVCGQYAILFTFGVALAINVGLTKNGNSFAIGVSLLMANLVVLAIALGVGICRSYERVTVQRPLSNKEMQLVEAGMQGQTPGDGGADGGAGIEMRGPAPPAGQDDTALRQYLLNQSDLQLEKRVGAGSFGEVFFCFLFW